MTNPGALTVLKQNPMFRGLPDSVLATVSGLCSNRQYDTGAVVFAQGEPGKQLFGVISGQIRISTESANGQELYLNIIYPGEIVGEIAFLDGGTHTATGRAAQPSTCFVIQRAPFMNLLEREPKLAVHLLELVCSRARWTSKLVADSAFLSVPERLATRLAQLATARGDGPEQCRLRMSQVELAQFLGVSRQVVNGHLQRWQKQGFVTLSRGSIVVHDLSAVFRGDVPPG